jgi:hypothetical protein
MGRRIRRIAVVAVVLVIAAIVVLSVPATRRLVGLSTIIRTEIEDNLTENPEPVFTAWIPDKPNALGNSWECATLVRADGPIIGEWRDVHDGLFGTEIARQEVHRSWVQASPAVARLGLPGEGFPFSIGSAPDGSKWRKVLVTGRYLDAETGPYPLEEHEISGSRFLGIAMPKGLPSEGDGYSMWTSMGGEAPAKEGYEYLCVPTIGRDVLWERGRYRIRRGKDSPPVPDLRKDRILHTQYSSALYKRRCTGPPDPETDDRATTAAASPAAKTRPGTQQDRAAIASHRITFDEGSDSPLDVVYGGRKVGTTVRPIRLRSIDADAVLLAYRINADGTVDFLVDAETPLAFKRDGVVVRVGFDRVRSSMKYNHTAFQIHVVQPSLSEGTDVQ